MQQPKQQPRKTKYVSQEKCKQLMYKYLFVLKNSSNYDREVIDAIENLIAEGLYQALQTDAEAVLQVQKLGLI